MVHFTISTFVSFVPLWCPLASLLRTAATFITKECKTPMAARQKLPPIHPGVILKKDLEDAGISLNRLARGIRVPMNRISAIVNGQRSITADTALRLALFFGAWPQYWMNLQTNYDLALAEYESGEQLRLDVKALVA